MITYSKSRKVWQKITDKLSGFPAPDLNLFARLYIAQIFFLSGRTKASSPEGEGLWQCFVAFVTPSETTLFLFEEEYALPFMSFEIAAHLALYAETFLPILLIIGFAARLSALALLGMTAVIQLFVYPNLWHEHLIWAAVLVFLILKGAGKISLEYVGTRR